MIVRPIIDYAELTSVYRLTHDAYVAEGYIVKRESGLLIHYPRLDGIPETTVLVAVDDGMIIGTNSVTVDGPEGVHCEADFPLQVHRERWAGSAFCCSWRIVTSQSYRDDWRVLLALMKETVAEFFRRQTPVCLMTFHPTDALRWMKLLRATVIGFSETTTGLRNAPAILIRGDARQFPRQLLAT
jgi:N-acyl amino acid synthase FeeM